MPAHTSATWRLRFVVGLCLVALLAAVPASSAQAALRGCRADPVFILSDGTVLDVTVEIATDVSNVKSIEYVVHGPRGTYLVAVQSTPTIGFEGKEIVRYVADAAPNHYVTDTLVRTSVKKVPATSYTAFAANTVSLGWNLSLGLAAEYAVVEGLTGQHLIAYLHK